MTILKNIAKKSILKCNVLQKTHALRRLKDRAGKRIYEVEEIVGFDRKGFLNKKSLIFVFIVFLSSFFSENRLFASERGNFYLSGGYIQNFMFTGDNSSSGGDDANVNFTGGYGLHISPGFQGENRWGFQIPLYLSYHTLSRSRIASSEHIYYFGTSFAGVVRFFKKPLKKWDPYFSFGLGINHVTEGGRRDGSGSWGPSLDLALGLDYHIQEKWSIHAGVPMRLILFIGDNLTDDVTGVSSIPISLGVTWKF